MNRVLEGIDRCDPQLILEASKEFEGAAEELKKNMEAFVNLGKPFIPMSKFFSMISVWLDDLKKVDMSKISDEYSFKDHVKMLKSQEDESPERAISKAATEYPIYVNALKNGIMAIAKWAEQFPEVFSVGKNGIVFQKQFGDIVSAKNPELKIKDMCGADQIGILKAMSAAADEEEIKETFKSIWLPEGTEAEKEDEAWTKFTGGFEKLGQAGKAAYDAAKKEVNDTEPPDEVKSAGNKSGGFLKSLLSSVIGEGLDEKIDISLVTESLLGQQLEGDEGLFALTFPELQELITKVLEFVGAASAKSAAALQAVNKQTEETMQPEENQGKLWDLFNNSELKMGKDDIALVGAALEEVGWDKNKDWNSLDKSKVKDSLMKVFGKDEAKANAVMNTLYESGGITEKDLKTALEDPSIDELMAKVHKFAENRMEYSAYFDIFKEKGGPDASFDNKDLFASQFMDEVIPKLENKDENTDAKSVLENWLSSLLEKLEAADVDPKENIYRRWGRIAGILKD